MCLCEAGLELVVVGEGIVLASFRLSNAQASLSCGLLAIILLLEAADEVVAMLTFYVFWKSRNKENVDSLLEIVRKRSQDLKKAHG